MVEKASKRSGMGDSRSLVRVISDKDEMGAVKINQNDQFFVLVNGRSLDSNTTYLYFYQQLQVVSYKDEMGAVKINQNDQLFVLVNGRSLDSNTTYLYFYQQLQLLELHMRNGLSQQDFPPLALDRPMKEENEILDQNSQLLAGVLYRISLFNIVCAEFNSSEVHFAAPLPYNKHNSDGMAKFNFDEDQRSSSSNSSALMSSLSRRFIGSVTSSRGNADTNWVLDSGSSYHITGNKDLFKRLTVIDAHSQLEFATATSGAVFCPTHIGDVRTEEIKLSGVYFIEGFSMNIISAGILEAQGLQVDFGNAKFSVVKPSTGRRVGSGFLNINRMCYVVTSMNWKKTHHNSEVGSAMETIEGSKSKIQEQVLEDTKMDLNRKRKRRTTKELWIVDSANPHHLTGSLHYMRKYHYMGRRQISLDTPFGQKIYVRVEGKKRSRAIRLNKVWYSPDMSYNLISVPQLDLEGYRFRLFDGLCTIWWKNKPEPVGTATSDTGNNLYYAREFRAVSQEDRKTYA